MDSGLIQRRKLHEEVSDRLMREINNGRFAPGDRLPSEREIMTEYGVGRPAVREALQGLARMGIISITQGERARVAEPDFASIIKLMGYTARHTLLNSPATLEHLKNARLVFETAVVRMAAELARPADIERLRERLEAQRRSPVTDPDFLLRDMEFHREIASIAGNPIFTAVSLVVFEWLGYFYVDAVRAPGAEALTLEEHNVILEAIASRDPDEAAKLMSDHLTRANHMYRVLIKR